MLRIYKEGGGRGGLNLEVERWEGIVRDIGNEPAGLRDMSEAEKKVGQCPCIVILMARSLTRRISFSLGLLIPNFVGDSQRIS